MGCATLHPSYEGPLSGKLLTLGNDQIGRVAAGAHARSERLALGITFLRAAADRFWLCLHLASLVVLAPPNIRLILSNHITNPLL